MAGRGAVLRLRSCLQRRLSEEGRSGGHEQRRWAVEGRTAEELLRLLRWIRRIQLLLLHVLHVLLVLQLLHHALVIVAREENTGRTLWIRWMGTAGERRVSRE